MSPPPALRRIEPLAAETSDERGGVLRLGKAVDVEPVLAVIHRVTTRAERKLATELGDDAVVPHHLVSTQRDLMWPVSINRGGTQLSLPIDHHLDSTFFFCSFTSVAARSPEWQRRRRWMGSSSPSKWRSRLVRAICATRSAPW